MKRLVVLFASQLVLWAVVTEFNDLVAGTHIHLFVAALFVSFAALTQPFRAGIASSILIGLVFDANTPVLFGTHMLLFASTHVILHSIRDRVPRANATGRFVTVLAANFGMFVVFCVAEAFHSPAPGANWPRLLPDLLASETVLALGQQWFFALQSRALELARVERTRFV